MDKYITLIGTEEVRSAGREMSSAAAEMQRAASNFNGAMDRFERLIERFEAACSQASGSVEPTLSQQMRAKGYKKSSPSNTGEVPGTNDPTPDDAKEAL